MYEIDDKAMKHWTSMFALASGITATSAVWAQGYTVMGGGEAAPPPAPAGAQLVVQPPPGPAASGHDGQTTTIRQGATARRPEDYGGITPGTPALPPGFRRRPRAGTLVAWPGFQMVPGGSRAFVVLTAPQPVTEAGRSGRARVFHLPNARIALSNNRRPLLTEAFNTPLARASLRPARGGVDVVLELRADLEPTVSQETNGQGYQFVFFTFPAFTAPAQTQIVATHGDARPVVPPAPAAPAAPIVQVGAPHPGTDHERPPGVR